MSHKILIVDDDEGMLQILGLILDRAGFKTLVADNGEDALSMVYDHRPTVIILDEMMPGLSGGEVCFRIKTDETVSSTAVIMHSAGTQIQSDTYLKRIRADAALAKPCPPRKIIEVVNSFVAPV